MAGSTEQPGLHSQDHAAHDGHGNSVAAWTAVAIITLAFAIGCGAVLASKVWLFWVAVAIALLGIAAGKVLALMGFGVHGSPAAKPTADPIDAS